MDKINMILSLKLKLHYVVYACPLSWSFELSIFGVTVVILSVADTHARGHAQACPLLGRMLRIWQI